LESPQYLDQPARLFAKKAEVRRLSTDIESRRPTTRRKVEGEGEPAVKRRETETEKEVPSEEKLEIGPVPEKQTAVKVELPEEVHVPVEIPAVPTSVTKTVDDFRASRGVVRKKLADAERVLRYNQERFDLLEDASRYWDEYRSEIEFRSYRGVRRFPRLLKDELERLRTDIPANERQIAGLRQEINDINAEIDSRTGFRPGAEADYADLNYDKLGDARTPICFAADTPVHTATGIRPIEALKVDDLIYSFDTANEITELKPVTAIFQNWTDIVMDISIDQDLLHVTRGHPFATKNWIWKEARLLRSKEHVYTISGKYKPVDQMTMRASVAKTYNLEVADHHNYFVGNVGTLVHNSNTSTSDNRRWISTKRSTTSIYVVVDESQHVIVNGVRRPRVIYVGKTFQGESGDIEKRFRGHLGDNPQWRDRQKTISPMPVDEYLGLSRPVKGNWTEFEAAVWEQHFIDMFGGKRGSGRTNPYQAQLENEINAITNEKFEMFKDGYGHNPCR
jgi:hypothetical protein